MTKMNHCCFCEDHKYLACGADIVATCADHFYMIKPEEVPFKVQLKDLLGRRNIMISYLKLKLEEEDWHGVQDAASDLRDIDTEMATLERIVKNG